ncbi:MAG: MAPEG family protein [Proteobacteria bacterium]|nr:MAPEG family protein [Pseudomonadota bacterium]
MGVCVFPRVVAVLTRKRPANDFSADKAETDLGERARRAHANCVENLPIFATVVLIGAVIAFEDVWFDRLALVYVGARVVQTLVHLSSVSALAVNVRFHFFTVQVACVVSMGALLIGQG